MAGTSGSTTFQKLDYRGGRDEEIAELILSIQNKEAGVDLSIEEQPDLLDIVHAYRDGASGSLCRAQMPKQGP